MTEMELKQIRKQKKESLIQSRVSERAKELLTEISEEKNKSVSSIIEDLVYSFLKKSGKKLKQ